jgi:hypothetical protein
MDAIAPVQSAPAEKEKVEQEAVVQEETASGEKLAQSDNNGEDMEEVAQTALSPIEPVALKSGMRVRYQRWYGTLSAQNSKGWFVIWDNMDSFTEKQHGLPPTEPIHPDELDI